MRRYEISSLVGQSCALGFGRGGWRWGGFQARTASVACAETLHRAEMSTEEVCGLIPVLPQSLGLCGCTTRVWILNREKIKHDWIVMLSVRRLLVRRPYTACFFWGVSCCLPVLAVEKGPPTLPVPSSAVAFVEDSSYSRVAAPS